jgi:hypothetical protein
VALTLGLKNGTAVFELGTAVPFAASVPAGTAPPWVVLAPGELGWGAVVGSPPQATSSPANIITNIPMAKRFFFNSTSNPFHFLGD